MLFTFFKIWLILLVAPNSALAEWTEIVFKANGSTSSQNRELQRVAIIGSGIAGANAAYQLHELTYRSPRFDVTIFERSSNFGGRIKSVPWGPEPHYSVDVGASHFLSNDRCVMESLQYVGLSSKPDTQYMRFTTPIGLWDGNELRPMADCQLESESWFWEHFDFLKRIHFNPGAVSWAIQFAIDRKWKPFFRLMRNYGRSYRRFRRKLYSDLEKWDSFAALAPFINLTEEFRRIGLADNSIIGSSENYLKNFNIAHDFQQDYVQPCTRARFSQNLANLRGLAALTATGTGSLVTVRGEMSDLIKNLIGMSLRLNTQVTQISPGQTRRYRLTTSGTDSKEEQSEFDIVILAAPLESSNIEFLNLPKIQTLVSGNHRYTEAHITQFTTPEEISPKHFSPLLNANIPGKRFTKSNTSNNASILSLITSPFDFIRSCPGCDLCECDEVEYENLHRILSRDIIDDAEIVRMIGKKYREGSKLSDYGISWIHRQPWPHAFPKYEEHQPLLEQVEIAPGLYNLNGAEEVVSSLEMSCRMGKNIAKWIHYH